ncbi:MAG: hypothetical protein PHQ36_04935 [Anaerolineales bacterium]|nr:hypothetical protein [Anaerolineales bacterium]
MTTIKNINLQFLIYFGISILILGFVGTLYFTDRFVFARFLGRINPLTAFPVVIILGFILPAILISKNWFAIYEAQNLKWQVRYAGLAILLGIIMALVDLRVKLLPDMNILFPQSLLFYPAIGFLVEIVFHLLPVTVLLLIVKTIFKDLAFEHLTWICIVIVATIEPIYQTIDMASANRYPLWAIIYVCAHVFVIKIAILIYSV